MAFESAYFAQRATNALELLAFGPATAAQVAASLQIHPRTARRILRTLEAGDWLESSVPGPGGATKWEPTLKLAAISAHLVTSHPLGRTAVAEAEVLQRGMVEFPAFPDT